MLHTCVQRFDVMENLKKFRELNKAVISHCGGLFWSFPLKKFHQQMVGWQEEWALNSKYIETILAPSGRAWTNFLAWLWYRWPFDHWWWRLQVQHFLCPAIVLVTLPWTKAGLEGSVHCYVRLHCSLLWCRIPALEKLLPCPCDCVAMDQHVVSHCVVLGTTQSVAALFGSLEFGYFSSCWFLTRENNIFFKKYCWSVRSKINTIR